MIRTVLELFYIYMVSREKVMANRALGGREIRSAEQRVKKIESY